MKNRKIILISLGVIILFILVMYQITKQPHSPESEVARALTEYKKALKERDIHKLWEGISKYPQQIEGGKEEAFKEHFEENLAANPDYARYEYEVYIDKVKMITPYRAWVTVHHPKLAKLKQYYMVKEDGKWKKGGLGPVVWNIRVDTNVLGEAIRKYYADKGHLPYSLSELVPGYIESLPVDPFSDENKTYHYEVTGDKTWMMYSVGLDSHDDLGMVKYEHPADPYFMELDKGDIIIEGGI